MRVLKPILLLAIVLVMAGCGLPDQYYIQSPTAGITPAGTGSQFSFSNPDHTKDLNINFKGYEIYYQLYAPNSTININPYDPNNTSDVYSQLTSAGYRLMTSSADIYPNRTDPVIPISVGDIGTAFTVTVSITTHVPVGTAAAQYTTSIFGFGNLRRSVQDTVAYPTFYKDFQYNITTLGNYNSADADCSNILSIISGGTDPVWLVMFAVSYGLIGVSTPQRSVPTYLGYITITINS
jgi:hypothetical protein